VWVGQISVGRDKHEPCSSVSSDALHTAIVRQLGSSRTSRVADAVRAAERAAIVKPGACKHGHTGPADTRCPPPSVA
jgi:hypothetical protein